VVQFGWCHPERSRFSGGAQSLPLDRPGRKPDCTTTEIQNPRKFKTLGKPNIDGFSTKTSDHEAYKRTSERKTVVAQFGLHAGTVAREILAPLEKTWDFGITPTMRSARRFFKLTG
jgi:hypothetical protein